MKSRNIIILFIVSSFFVYGCQSSEKALEKDGYYVAAYVYPGTHSDPLAIKKWHPQGIGDWEFIKIAKPRYDGHYQPKVPLWGYEMDNDPKVVEKWIDAATDHGINVFTYCWYWYEEGPFLEGGLNDGFLKAKNNKKMYFNLMWANHDIRKRPPVYIDDTSVLFHGAVDWKNFTIIVDRVIKQYFHKPNYFKIDGQPVFSIFDLGKLLESFGGSTEETRKALDYFREEARKSGLPGVHFQCCTDGWLRTKREAELIEEIGFNSATSYNMLAVRNTEDYIENGSLSLKAMEQRDEMLNIPFFPCISIGWDNTPRYANLGKENTVHYNKTPESFAALLSKAKKFVDKRPNQSKLIMINAWNEWAEDNYLLPDMKYGFSYLEAVKNVMNGKYDKY